MGILQQIIAEFINQVPNAGLLFLFPIVAVLMSLITTAGITMGAMFDAKAEAIEREKSILEKMKKEEDKKLKLLLEGS